MKEILNENEKEGLIIPLDKKIIGFDKQPIFFQDMNNKVREMTVRDVLQYGVSTLSPEQDIKNLKLIHRLMPRIDDDKKELVLNYKEDTEFLINSIILCKAINPVPKSIVLNLLGAI